MAATTHNRTPDLTGTTGTTGTAGTAGDGNDRAHGGAGDADVRQESIVAELRAAALEQSWAERRDLPAPEPGPWPGDDPPGHGPDGTSGERTIRGWAIDATCPACGRALTHVADGSTNRFRAQTISECGHCRRSFSTVITVSDATQDLRRTKPRSRP